MRAWGIGGLVAACLALVVPSTAFAAGTTFHVNTTNDTLSAGACAAATAGQCSLREAVIESNATPPTAGASNTINVPAGTYQLTRSSAGGGPADNGAGALATPGLIKAYAERDMYTALHILARRDTRDHHGSFAAVVASSAAAVRSRQLRM